MSYIQSGKDEGAKLVSGGNRIDRPGFFIEPTVFTECHDDMKMVREEIFGQVYSVLKFSDVDEVIQRANNTTYGLVGSVFSKDSAKCH